jgi:hypothetical protein
MLLFFTVTVSACKKFLAVELPVTLIPQQAVFSDDIAAISAVKGLYVYLINADNFSSGSSASAATLTGLSADELNNYKDITPYISFEQNDLRADNTAILSLWTSVYNTIYDANSILEGLAGSTNISADMKNQLSGEALFIRAYCYFYLVNLFADVPLLTSTDYKINSVKPRTTFDSVYTQITTDLTDARALLRENYQEGPERVRVNRSTATALLARVYSVIPS